jgi:anthranilate synthase component 1
VWHRFVADTMTPVGAALRLMAPQRGDFLLESVDGGEVRGRYSLLGLDPDLVFRAEGAEAHINAVWQTNRDAFVHRPGDPLEQLQALHTDCRFEPPEDLPPALACLVGYLGFETASLVEELPKPASDPLALPDILFVRPTVLLIFDQLKDEAFCIAPIWSQSGDVDNFATDAIATARRRIERTMVLLSQSDGSTVNSAPASQNDSLPDYMAPQAMLPADRYAEMVKQAKEYIAAGDIFQVVLAQRFTAPFDLPPFALYRALRRVNPSPFLYFLDLPGFVIVGSSPEILVRVRDGEVTIRPIAGTRPRGATPAADLAAEADLLADPKERAEHLMLLDLGRNDVGRIAEAGSVVVTGSYMVERYSHVMHIVSNVCGRLGSRHTALDAVLAGFPAGTVSGAPKIRACHIIAELEDERRGPYGGAVGYFAPDGSLDSCIVLRTAVVKDGMMHVTAGAGIVAESNAASEQRECEAKAGALFAAAREAIALAGGERAR